MEQVRDFVRGYYRYCLNDDGYGLEAYVDYRDKLELSTVKDVLEHDTPEDYLWESTDDWLRGYWSYETVFWKELESFCHEKEINLDEARDYIYENFYWEYPEYFINPQVPITIMIDGGDAHCDFVQHNVMNYCKNWYDSDITLSGLGWLARQQRELTNLKKAIKGGEPSSKFVKSCVEELSNLPNHMSCLAFFCTMSLEEAIAIKEGRFDSITLPGGVEAGLINTWEGGGSLLGLEIQKQVIIPKDKVFKVFCDDGRNRYWPCNVYGMSEKRGQLEAFVKIA